MELLIVTGMSGSGKSCVMDVMEDIGYYCIDNLPPKLIPQFVDLCRKSESEIKKIAVAFDIRTRYVRRDIPCMAGDKVGQNNSI